MPAPTARRARTARRGAIGLGVVLVAQLMLVLDATVVNVALPHIQTDLGFTPAGLSWVLNAYTLAFGGLLLLGGRLGDVFGRLRTFEIGLGDLHRREPARRPRDDPGLAHRRPHPSGRRRRARRAERPRPRHDERPERGRPQPRSGALHRGVVGRASIGLLLGGVLTDFVSWHWTLFVNVPIGAVVLVLARRFVTETPRIRGRFDVVGAVTATLGSVAVVHGFISAADRGWTVAARRIGSFVVGPPCSRLFVRTESRRGAPAAAARASSATAPAAGRSCSWRSSSARSSRRSSS